MGRTASSCLSGSVFACSGVWDKPPVLYKDPASSRERMFLSRPPWARGLQAGLTGTGLGGGVHAGAPMSGEGLTLAGAAQPSEAPGSCVVRPAVPGYGATSSGSRHGALSLWACRPPASPAQIPSAPLPAEAGLPCSHGSPSDLSSAQWSTPETTRTTSDLGLLESVTLSYQVDVLPANPDPGSLPSTQMACEPRKAQRGDWGGNKQGKRTY